MLVTLDIFKMNTNIIPADSEDVNTSHVENVSKNQIDHGFMLKPQGIMILLI